MTKIAIQPSGSGTGTFTIAAPNSNTNRTFTLPDAGGEVLTDQSSPPLTQGQAEDPASTVFGTVSGQRLAQHTDDAFNVTGDAPKYACRAWVNFNGQTTPPTIRASGNVSSVTRTSVAVYVVNLAEAMPDADYAVHLAVSPQFGLRATAPQIHGTVSGAQEVAPTTTSFTVHAMSGTFNDVKYVSVAIFR